MKGLNEQDWVVPMKPNLGMWRSLLGGCGRGREGVGGAWLSCAPGHEKKSKHGHAPTHPCQ